MKTQYLSIGAAAALIFGALGVTSLKAEEKPDDDVREEIAEALEKQENKILSATEPTPKKEEAADKASASEGKEKKEEELSPRDLSLKNHREELKIYDLDEDGRISEDEWKAANKKNPERNDKFNLIDKDKDGQIDDNEAVTFLMQRLSVESTYVGESDDNGTEVIIEDGVEENAPSEVRFTLFSIPIGD